MYHFNLLKRMKIKSCETRDDCVKGEARSNLKSFLLQNKRVVLQLSQVTFLSCIIYIGFYYFLSIFYVATCTYQIESHSGSVVPTMRNATLKRSLLFMILLCSTQINHTVALSSNKRVYQVSFQSLALA